MTEKLKMPCAIEYKDHELGIYNHIHALYIPVGVLVFISFTNTPNEEDLYPLTDEISHLGSDGELVDEPKQVYIHTTGTSAEDIILICSGVGTGEDHIKVKPLNSLALEPTTKAVIENLDKLINPYQEPVLTPFESNATSLTTLISKTLTCDRIKINHIGAMSTITNHCNGSCQIFLDGNRIDTSGGYGGTTSTGQSHLDITNVKGKLLEIKQISGGGTYVTVGLLQEFTKKP